MEISDRLRCLFSGQLEERDGRYVVEIPKRELEYGTVSDGETYRVAMLATAADSEPPAEQTERAQTGGQPDPPVDEGETRTVEIEDIGDQGDGITRVERGYIVIVPDTEKGERVRIEISDVQENVAFADVVERLSYYE